MSNKIEAVIFDWAGTTVDFGSFAPTQIFVEAFKTAFDFDITLAESRGPMGMGKIDHIRTLLNDPEIRGRWTAQFGTAPTEADAQNIYETFMPLQIEHVVHFAEPIAGTLDVVNTLKSQGIKIGSCSGYPTPVMDVLVPVAAQHGYQPDCVVASDEIKAGSRPGPWMALKNVIELGVKNVANCVKVDDATSGIAEGLNAGMWAVGITVSGNEFGATLAEYQQMTTDEINTRKAYAEKRMKDAGAHYVIETVADLPKILEEIQKRRNNGEKP
ncbi:MAG: phosphonoacetaldehyde hydrolase [Wohlfahrtiimonas sp.]